MYEQPRFLPAGDRGIVVEFGDEISEEVNAAVRRFVAAAREAALTGVEEVVPTYRSAAVYFDPLRVGRDQLVAELRSCLRGAARVPLPAGRTVVVPTVYGGEWGPDLEDVARHAGITPAEVVEIHSSASYPVYMLGFMPGFPYLGGLSPRIACPRLANPRQKIPAGSVGIAGNQTGIYPQDSPGGWRIIGRTPLRLYDPWRDPPSLCMAGDRLRFRPIDQREYEAIRAAVEAGTYQPEVEMPAAGRAVSSLLPGGPGEAAARPGGRPQGRQRVGGYFTVLQPGLFTTIQDLGRTGYQEFGVPVAGAMDALALRVANRLVGNPEGAAGLEITLLGPTLRFETPTVIALTGADLGALLDGSPLPTWQSVAVAAGSTLSFSGPRAGARAYLAVAGGVAVPPLLGSRSTYVRAAMGGWEGRALRAGDVLPVGQTYPLPPAGRRFPPELIPALPREVTVRVILGPQDDHFPPEAVERFLQSKYRVSAASDRMGYRLEGPALSHARGPDIVSDSIPPGAVQVPGQGTPIVLLADRQTAGGYPKIAVVIAADLRLLAQLQPGDSISFRAVSQEEAVAALREQEQTVEVV